MPCVHAAEPFEPVICRAIERDYVQPRLDQGDKGQEMLAIEPVLVKLAGRTI